MKGFSEELKGRTFMFRGGELAEDYGTKWTHACVFHVRDHPVAEHALAAVAWLLRRIFRSEEGEFIGMHTEPPTITSHRLGCRLAHELGFSVSHKRMKANGSYLIRETQGSKGELRMAKVSRTFSKEHLAKSHPAKATYDKAVVVADLRAMADAAELGEIVLITRRICPVGEASDGSGMPGQCAFLEWKFPNGAPTPTTA